MKSEIEIKDDIYALLKGSQMANAVTGQLCKRKRPLNSSKEDITIAILSSQGKTMQEAFVNVNIYVQDTWVKDQYEENSQRLRELCEIAETTLTGVINKEFRIELAEQHVYADDNNEHFINNKILYQINNE